MKGWLRRLRIFLIYPLCLVLLGLCLAEGALRVAGYGHSTHAFLVKNWDGKKFYVFNKYVFRRFLNNVDPGMWDLTEFEAIVPKPPNTCRILVVGGGQSWGWPDASFSQWRILETMLKAQNPDIHFEVLNASFPLSLIHI